MAQNHAASGDIIDLQPLGPAIAGSVTTALIKSRQLELVRIVLPAGKTLRQHQVPGEITVLCIEGEIEFTTLAGKHLLQPGQLIHLAASAPHDLRALADATALLTICLAAP